MSKRLKRSRLELESLPDEMLLKIFSYMNIQELLQYGQVSKRIRAICSDKSFWEETNLDEKKVEAEFIKFILDRNCELLVVKNTVIDGNVKLNRPSKLSYLQLTGCCNDNFYDEILNSCSSLISLHLNCMKPSSNIVLQSLCKRNGQTLKYLDLGECKWISNNSIQVILKYCTQLTKITLWGSNMSQNAMDLFVNGLSTSVKKVGANPYNVTDKHIETLVSRCNQIAYLDLSGTELTDTSITSVIYHLKQSLEYLDIYGSNKISFEKVLELKSMPKLRILKYGFKTWHTMVLRKKLPDLEINQNDFRHF